MALNVSEIKYVYVFWRSIPACKLLTRASSSNQRGAHTAIVDVQRLYHIRVFSEDHLHPCIDDGEGKLPPLCLTEGRNELPLQKHERRDKLLNAFHIFLFQKESVIYLQ